MSNTILRTLAAAALLSAVACGGSDGGPSYSNTVDAATATASANDAASWATGVSESMLNFNVSTEVPLVRGTTTPRYAEELIARMRARGFARLGRTDLAATASPFRVAGVCEPTETGIDGAGDPIDSDSDGIPNDYKLDFGSSCTDTEGDYSIIYSGYLRIRDVAGLFGYRVDAGNFKIRWTHLSEYEQFSLNGYETGAFTASAITNATDMDYGEAWSYAVVAAPPVELGPTGTGSVAWSLVANSAYDPDGTIAWGSPVPSGSLDITADYKVRFSGEAGSDGFHFMMETTTPLSIEATPCEGPVAGVINGELNGMADVGFTVTWTACHTYNVVTRGTTEVATVRRQ